jgi:hypothetical protein
MSAPFFSLYRDRPEATSLAQTVVRHDLVSDHLYCHVRSFFDTNALWVFL